MRAPAHTGISPGRFAWAPLNDRQRAQFAPLVTGARASIEKSSRNESGDLPAYLRVLDDDGVPSAFVKTAPASLKATFVREGRLAEHLHSKGLRAPRVRKVIALDNQIIAAVYDWIDGTHPTAQNADFERLGAGVASLQRALATVRDDFDIAGATAARLRSLLGFAASDRARLRWAKDPYADFAALATEWFVSLTPSMAVGAGPCHGDLNPGNLLVDDEGRLTFLDLEDALRFDVWRGLDLAKVAERLILPEAVQNGDAWGEDAVKALALGYGADASAQGPRAEDALRWHIGLAVQLIGRHYPLGGSVALPELGKFKNIADSLSRAGALLNSVA